jgi:hypothetical protein
VASIAARINSVTGKIGKTPELPGKIGKRCTPKCAVEKPKFSFMNGEFAL